MAGLLALRSLFYFVGYTLELFVCLVVICFDLWHFTWFAVWLRFGCFCWLFINTLVDFTCCCSLLSLFCWECSFFCLYFFFCWCFAWTYLCWFCVHALLLGVCYAGYRSVCGWVFYFLGFDMFDLFDVIWLTFDCSCICV